MAYCSNCGAPLVEGDMFCRKCGQSIAIEGSTPGNAGNTPVQYRLATEQQMFILPEQTPSDRPHMKTTVLVAVICVLAAIAIVFILLFTGILPGWDHSGDEGSTTVSATNSQSTGSSSTGTTSTTNPTGSGSTSTTSTSNGVSSGGSSSTSTGSSTTSAPLTSPKTIIDSNGYSVTIPTGFALKSSDSSETVYENADLGMTITLTSSKNSSRLSAQDCYSSALGSHSADYSYLKGDKYVASWFSDDGTTEYYTVGFATSSALDSVAMIYPASNSSTCDGIVTDVYHSYSGD